MDNLPPDFYVQLSEVSHWPSELPPRAVLSGISPMGSCGLTREEIVSWLMRLSDKHSLQPTTLAARLVVPQIAGNRTQRAKLADAWWEPAVRGKGRQAREWCAALSALTRQTNLEVLTLLPVGHLLPESKLLAQSQRFCPHCYKADVENQRPVYNRLLWSLDAVHACPTHGVFLPKGCPYCKENGAPPKAYGKYMPGVCSKCAYDLSNTPTKEAELLDIDAARRIGEFLDHARWLTSAHANVGGVKNFLRQMTHKVADGQYSKLAKMLGSTKNNMHGWIHGHVVPSFPAVVRMAQVFDCPISDVVLNNEIFPRYKPQFSKTPLRLHAPRCRNGKVNWTSVHDKIEELASEQLPLREVALAAGVDEKYLRRRFSEQAKEVVQASRDRKRKESEGRGHARIDAYRQAHREVVAQGKKPSRRRVLAHLAPSGIRLGWHEVHKAYWLARQEDSAPLRPDSAAKQ